MKTELTLVFAAMICACEIVDYTPDKGKDISHNGNVLYSCAVEFPQGYNWRRDSLGGRVRTDLVYFREGIEQFRITAGEGNEVSAYPDMHRIISGHLYTDYSSSLETVLKRDGVEMFRYQGRESIVDIAVSDTTIYTLGRGRSGDGWSFRKNGTIIAGMDTGRLLSGFFRDSDSLGFAYAQPLKSSDGPTFWRYYTFRGTRPSQLLHAADVTAILAVRVFNGVTHSLEKSSDIRNLLWEAGGKTTVLNIEADKCRDCNFVVASGEILAHVQYTGTTSNYWNDYFWRPSSLASSTLSDEQICAFCDNSPKLCFASSPMGGTGNVSVTYGHNTFIMGKNLALISPYALCCNANDFCIGLNDTNNDYRPFILRGLDTLKFDFNGYFTHLSLP